MMATKLNNVKVPVLADTPISYTCDWGYYSDGKTWHKGIDLITGKESAVIAAHDGKVINCANNIKGTNSSTDTPGMGNYVILETSDGSRIRTRYQHMKYGSVTVSKGDIVKKGQKIGVIGNTGNSSGRHLHFDISFNTKQTSSYYSGSRYYVDPKPYLLGSKKIGKAGTITGDYSHTVKLDVNVRSGAGTAYKIVDELSEGTPVKVCETNGKWSRIGTGRWVSSAYIVPIMTHRVRADVNVRKGPGTNYNIVDGIKAGNKVRIEQVSGSWGKISDTKWVSMNYLVKI